MCALEGITKMNQNGTDETGLDLDALEAVADAAGNWWIDIDHPIELINRWSDPLEFEDPADEEYLKAFDPPTVKRLIARIRELESAGGGRVFSWSPGCALSFVADGGVLTVTDEAFDDEAKSFSGAVVAMQRALAGERARTAEAVQASVEYRREAKEALSKADLAERRAEHLSVLLREWLDATTEKDWADYETRVEKALNNEEAGHGR